MSNESRKKAALHNLGCKVNSYETEAMQQELSEAGYEIVPFSERADLYVINTCTVTNIADRKSRQMIHRAKKLNPDALVVTAGCYAQIDPEGTVADEAVDLVIGNGQKHDLIRALVEHEKTGRTEFVKDIGQPGRSYEELRLTHPAKHARAFVKIQDGCDSFCSYCIIPYARGRSHSRAPEQVIREVEELTQNGFAEIVLTGIHISSYGTDLGISLLDLIRRIHEIEGVKRIRLGSLEPGIITEEFVSQLAGMHKICPHLHLSLQSGSDSVLKRMNRKYTTQEYLEKCAILRNHFEHPALTTDIIVGFPGESEEEFAATCEFVKKAAFYEIHVFPYSRRDGTAAARMDGQIPKQVRSERVRQLLTIASDLKAQFVSWYLGRQVEVLFEKPVTVNGERYYTGYTPEYVKTWLRTEECLQNRIIMVEFSEQIV